jgi:hypothetical protein
MRRALVGAGVAAALVGVACVAGAQSDGDGLELECSTQGTLPNPGTTFLLTCTEDAPPTTVATTVAPTTTELPATTSTAPATTTSTLPPTTSTTQPAPTTTASPPSGDVSFAEDFSTEAGFTSRFWRHTGNACSLDQRCTPEGQSFATQEFPGTHDMACAAPPSTRTVSIESHANLYWWCAPGGPATGHVMSGLNASGYALVSFAPAQWFSDVRRVCWDMSLADLGGGKWANVVLVPRARVQSHQNINPDRVADGEGPWRLDYVTPGFDPQDNNGPGGFNLVDIHDVVGIKQFRGHLGIYQGHEMAQQESTFTTGANDAQRFRHCFEDLGNGSLRITQNRANGAVQTFAVPGAFPAGEVAVIFQDDTYDADKHGGTGMYTWHWDNITVEEF